MDRETELRERLAALDREMKARAQPIIDELVNLESYKRREYLISLQDLAQRIQPPQQ